MKRILCQLFIACVTVFVCAQTQQGVVKTKGRLGNNGAIIPGKPLSGAMVIIKGRNAVVSSNNGSFSLTIPTNSYYLQNVQKQGYVLMDPDVLSKQYTYSKDPLVLVLEDKDQQMADRRAIERKISSSLYAQLQKRNDELEALKEQHKITDEKYRELLQKLNNDQDDNEKLISEMADRYSKMDFDDVDDFNRRISDYILNGRLTEADSLLSTKGDINSRAETLRQHQEANAQAERELKKKQKKLEKSKALTQKELEDLAQDCYRKFEIFKMQHQNDSAEYYIELRASLDTMNIQWQLETGDFILQYVSKIRLAERYYYRSLNISSQTNNLVGKANSFNNLGFLLNQLGKFEEALKYIEKSKEINNLLFGENSTEVAQNYNNIAFCYGNLGNFPKALEYLEKALSIQLNLTGEKNIVIVNTYNSIGMVNHILGHEGRALELFKKSLEIGKELFGEESSYIALEYNNISSVYLSTKEYEKALNFALKTLELRRLLYGEVHPGIAESYLNIGGINKEQKKNKEALDWFIKAADLYEKIYGNKHIDVALCKNNIGSTYDALGDYPNALKYLQESLELRKELLGDQHPSVASCYNNIGSVYDNLGKYDKAINNYEKSLSIRLAIFGDTHPLVSATYANIGFAYDKLGDDYNALQAFKKAEVALPQGHHNIEIIQKRIKQTLLKINSNSTQSQNVSVSHR